MTGNIDYLTTMIISLGIKLLILSRFWSHGDIGNLLQRDSTNLPQLNPTKLKLKFLKYDFYKVQEKKIKIQN